MLTNTAVPQPAIQHWKGVDTRQKEGIKSGDVDGLGATMNIWALVSVAVASARIADDVVLPCHRLAGHISDRSPHSPLENLGSKRTIRVCVACHYSYQR